MATVIRKDAFIERTQVLYNDSYAIGVWFKIRVDSSSHLVRGSGYLDMRLLKNPKESTGNYNVTLIEFEFEDIRGEGKNLKYSPTKRGLKSYTEVINKIQNIADNLISVFEHHGFTKDTSTNRR